MFLKISTRSFGFIAAVLSGIVLFTCRGTVVHAQEPTSRKFDEFGYVNAEDAMARLDHFALELRAHPESRGVIVGRNTLAGNYPRGMFLRRAHGYRNYLVNTRGIEDARVSVVEGERRREIGFELWTIPRNELSPISEEVSVPEPPSPVLFDQLATGPERQCVGDLPIELYKLEDGLRIFSDALQHHSRAKAWIVVRPRSGDSRAGTQRLVDQSRQLLIKNRIRLERILTATGSALSSICGQVNLWIAPASSTKADEAGYYSQLMNEAETREFTMRRVEFAGNAHIRDDVLRKQFMQTEGDVFSRRLLDQSLANFNRQGLVYPVTLNDIEVWLDREEKLIDIAVCFRERRFKK